MPRPELGACVGPSPPPREPPMMNNRMTAAALEAARPVGSCTNSRLPIDRGAGEIHQRRAQTIELDGLELMQCSVDQASRFLSHPRQRVARRDELRNALHFSVAQRAREPAAHLRPA